MISIIFIAGLPITLAVCYTLFAYTISEFDYKGREKWSDQG